MATELLHPTTSLRSSSIERVCTDSHSAMAAETQVQEAEPLKVSLGSEEHTVGASTPENGGSYLQRLLSAPPSMQTAILSLDKTVLYTGTELLITHAVNYESMVNWTLLLITMVEPCMRSGDS